MKLKRLSQLLGGVSCFWLALSASTSAAEMITLRLGSITRTVALQDLEIFAETGQISSELKLFEPLLTPDFQASLNRGFNLDPNLAKSLGTAVFNSEAGKQLTQQLEALLPGSQTQDFQTTLAIAIAKSNHLNILTFLRAYPEEKLTLNLPALIELGLQLQQTQWQSRFLTPLLEKELNKNHQIQPLIKFDPTIAGTQTVSETTLIFIDTARKRQVPANIYYPQASRGPLIVMSHGFAANRYFLVYLARHLASHGLTVVSVEHTGSNIEALEQAVSLNFLELLPSSEFLDRPLDISFVLDQLEKLNRYPGELQGKFNTAQVSLIGHSFGGYTVLALGGAKFNPKPLQSFCQSCSPLARSAGDWLQCAAANLSPRSVNLQDERVVQVIALNPTIGQLFGDSLGQMKIPVMIVAANEDGITPTLTHQLQPFQQLAGEKYLLMALGATHMSVTDISNLNSVMGSNTLVREVMGQEAEPFRVLLKGLILAFIKQLTPDAQFYQPFLSSGYVESFSTPNMSFYLVQELSVNLKIWLNLIYLANQQLFAVPRPPQSLFHKLRNSLLVLVHSFPKFNFVPENYSKRFL